MMSYDERLKKILNYDERDPFWFHTVKNFIDENYDDKEVAINDLEMLAEDKVAFNEFTRQLIQNFKDTKIVKDQFFGPVNKIKEYLKTKNVTDQVVKVLSKPYYKHLDIAKEFEFWIRTSTFVENNPVIESGYTAKRLYEEHKDKLDIPGVFSMLVTLREKPEKGLKLIAENFPRK